MGHFRYEEEELLLMSYVDEHEPKRSDARFLDTGCSNHMCGDRSMFSSLVDDIKHFVKCGSNTRMLVTGKGSVRLLFNGIHFMVSNVYYVPELRNNLLSVGQLQEKGLTILIKNGACNIYQP